MSDEKRINPDVKEIEYGKKELKKLTLYPLSVGDQFAVTDIITKIAQELIASQKDNKNTDYFFITSAISVIERNINKLLSLIADVSETEAEEIIKQLTNSQLLDIAEIIWEVNFEPALKKGQNLLERGRSLFGLKQSSPSSSSVIPSIESKMSTEKDTAKEE